MSVVSELYKVTVVGDGSTPSIAFNRKVFNSTDIKGVKYDTTTLAETALVNGSDFTVSGAGNESTGVTITPSSSIPSGTNWVMYSDQGSTQTTDLQSQGPFPANTIEYMSDKLAIAIQEVNGKVDRALLASLSSGSDLNLPSATNAYVYIDNNGDYTTIDASQVGGTKTINTQTGTAYTLALLDSGAIVEMNNASANTVTVPPNSSVVFDVGTSIDIQQYGAGATSLVAGSGVTVRGNLNVSAQYEGLTIYKRATDEWVAIGGSA